MAAAGEQLFGNILLGSRSGAVSSSRSCRCCLPSAAAALVTCGSQPASRAGPDLCCALSPCPTGPGKPQGLGSWASLEALRRRAYGGSGCGWWVCERHQEDQQSVRRGGSLHLRLQGRCTLVCRMQPCCPCRHRLCVPLHGLRPGATAFSTATLPSPSHRPPCCTCSH